MLRFFLFFMIFAPALSAQSFFQKGQQAYQKKQWGKAERLLNKALLEESGNEVATYKLLAEVHWAVKEYELALSDLHSAIELEPMNDSLYLMRSDAWSLYAMSALQQEPPCDVCPSDMKRLYNSLDESASLDMRAALEDAQKALEINPKSAQAHYRCGWLEYLFSHQAEACAHYQKALELGHPKAKEQIEAYCL